MSRLLESVLTDEQRAEAGAHDQNPALRMVPTIHPHARAASHYGQMAKEAQAMVEQAAEARRAVENSMAALLADLSAELRHADTLLRIALAVMTTEQKDRFARLSDAAGIGADGATRHHERGLVLARAEGRGL